MAEFHVFADLHEGAEPIKVRHIDNSDVFDALRLGFNDFWEKPSHYIFLCLVYPIVVIVLFVWVSGANALQLIYPLMTGFALLGPFSAIGLYEISRRRELNLDTSWIHAINVWKSPAIPAIAAIGALLVALFLSWLYAAQLLYVWIFSATQPQSFIGFVLDVVTTQRGWILIFVGNAVGFVFALAVLVCTVVALPLLLDRDVGAYTAIKTSARACLLNPIPMMIWGLIVAIGLFLGALPFLVGLAIVLPVLGHSTWHLYRKVIEVPASRK